MALSFTVTDVTPTRPNEAVGQHRERTVKIVTSGTYTTDGDTLTATQLGFKKITFFSATLGELGTSSFTALWPVYDPTTEKLRLYKSNSTSAFGQQTSGGSTAATFYARVCGI